MVNLKDIMTEKQIERYLVLIELEKNKSFKSMDQYNELSLYKYLIRYKGKIESIQKQLKKYFSE